VFNVNILTLLKTTNNIPQCMQFSKLLEALIWN